MQYEESLPSPLIEGENVLWSAKPKRKAFIINRIIRMMPFALIWLFLDLYVILTFINIDYSVNLLVIIPFFAIHLFPVWIWIGDIATANIKWKNTKYYVTDRRIIIQTGIIGASYQTIYYKDIKNVNLKIGLIDKLLGVGDIYIDTGEVRQVKHGVQNVFYSLLDVERPYEIYPKLQKFVMDIQTDMEFPNAYRPGENLGYNTKYKGEK